MAKPTNKKIKRKKISSIFFLLPTIHTLCVLGWPTTIFRTDKGG